MGKRSKKDNNQATSKPEPYAEINQKKKENTSRIRKKNTSTIVERSQQINAEAPILPIKKKKVTKKRKTKEKPMQIVVQRSLCPVNCEDHTLRLTKKLSKSKNKRRKQSQQQQQILSLSFCKKKDSTSNHLELPMFQNKKFLTNPKYSLFIGQNTKPNKLNFGRQKQGKQLLEYSFPKPSNIYKKRCKCCKTNQIIGDYVQHVKSSEHKENWQKDQTLIQIKEAIQQFQIPIEEPQTTSRRTRRTRNFRNYEGLENQQHQQ